MRRRIALAVVALLLFAGPLWGQKLTLPDRVTGDPGAFVKVAAATDCASVRWVALDKGLNVFPVELLKDSKTAVVSAAAAGAYRLMAYAAKGDVATDPAVCVVVIGEVPPPPGPGPSPPGPGPTPGPAPIPQDGFRVLVVYDTASLTKEQGAALRAGSVTDYLNGKCVKGPDGKTAEWRVWDQAVDVKNESKLWQDAFGRKRDKLPWIVVSTGKAGFEGPLPATADDLLALLKKYGG